MYLSQALIAQLMRLFRNIVGMRGVNITNKKIATIVIILNFFFISTTF
jgi:hypothetical protein